ncbi:MAG TPA: DUF2281 domain-containing protein [Chitinophagales bacterium]|nr:DUF2281 domain-containing protein [Chitinophagales bacterium]HRK27070.1 DUF2281 domain-containing protein [Chitinophagales bacterium]
MSAILKERILKEIQLLSESAQIEVYNYLLLIKHKYTKKTWLNTDSVIRPTFGCGSIKIKMLEDFDAPLEDFKEYM